MSHKFKSCYVDDLPESCMECPFMHVDNHLWSSKKQGYVSTQYCVIGEGGLRPLMDRWRGMRDPGCILKKIGDNHVDGYESTVQAFDEEPPVYDFPLEDSIPPIEYHEKPWKYTDNNEYADEYNQELIEQVNKRKMRPEELPIKEQFKMVFDSYKRNVQENILFDVLTRFYFADWTRQCDYEKMTSEEIINAVMDVCKKIEKDYKYSFDDDLYPMPWNITSGDGYDD